MSTASALPAPDWIWIVFTLIAVAAQTMRNALQRSLAARVGTLGATEVRFFFGLPFAIVIFAAVAAWGGLPRTPEPAFWGWLVVGAFMQIAATAFLLAAMRERSFVIAIAYSKTEPVQVAVFGLVFLGDALTAGVAVAVIAAVVGVMLLSWPRAMTPGRRALPVVQGLVSASCFALSSVAFRGAIQALDDPDYLVAATTTLAAGLVLQTLAMGAYTGLRAPATLRAVLRAWRPALLAGLLAAVASQFWFLGFAVESAAKVRTLGVVEIVFAQAVSLRLFREPMGWRELAGLALVALAVVTVVNG
ncbi:MAG TPA: EamA/RhaT family transporter [Hyphomicrobiales bacterium]|nr:EamA/RhaT family transporter [Hyphomicrobiales bacterium]